LKQRGANSIYVEPVAANPVPIAISLHPTVSQVILYFLYNILFTNHARDLHGQINDLLNSYL